MGRRRPKLAPIGAGAERWQIVIYTGPPTPHKKFFFVSGLVSKSPPACGVCWPSSLFAGVCPGAYHARVVPRPGVARRPVLEFLAQRIRGGLAHSIQLLGRPLCSRLTPARTVTPGGITKKLAFFAKKNNRARSFLLIFRELLIIFIKRQKPRFNRVFFCPAHIDVTGPTVLYLNRRYYYAVDPSKTVSQVSLY